MKFDDVLKDIGEFGSYQKFIYVLLCLPSLFIAVNNFNIAFFLYTPKHRCKIPGYENDTYIVQNEYHQMLIDKYIPKDGPGSGYHTCALYEWSNSTNTTYGNDTELIECSSWVYDQSVFVSTLTSTEDLVCGDAGYTAHITMLVLVGDGFGAFMQGMFSDRMGRKKMFICELMLMIVFGLSLAWSPDVLTFTILKLIMELVSVGIYSATFVHGMEIVGPSKRRVAGLGITYFYAAGLMLAACIAFALRDWFYIALVSSGPCIVFISYIWLVPESPRWLIGKGRKEEAFDILYKIAKANNRIHKLHRGSTFDNEVDDVEDGGIRAFFKSRTLFKKTIVLCINAFAVIMCYYGLTLNISNLSGNYFLNFLINAVIEIPAYTLCFLLMDRPKIGRKGVYMSSVIIGGVSLLCTIVPILLGKHESSLVIILLSMIGKMGLAGAYAIISIWSAELFPTCVRNTGLGLSTGFGCVGTILSPYIADMSKYPQGQYGKVLSLIAFGLITIFAGILALSLPETLNKNLLEDITDLENSETHHLSDTLR